MDYAEAWELQKRLVADRTEGQMEDTLLLLEHPHTYTLGRSGKIENLLMSDAERREHGVSVHWVDRGGDITYHGPGQLVGYPIVAVGSGQWAVSGGAARDRIPQVDYVRYLRDIEIVLIRALAVFGVRGERVSRYTGVWVGDEKIAAIGVKVNARGISSHGFALNVCADLSYFAGIVPCGIHDRGVTSLDRLLGRPVTIDEAADVVVDSFGAVFGLEMERPAGSVPAGRSASVR
jgi:lipoyl(octanoyl) transferase